ncbi:MAG: glycosyltransferase family 4 protein, partial [bacterium]
PAKFMVQAMMQLLLHSFRGRYDVIHTHNMPNVLALSGLPFRLFGTKVILDVHDTMPEAYATKFGYELDQFPVKLFVREELLSAACSNKVITTNVMHREVLVEHGIAHDKIELIYNVGNTKYFKPMSRGTNGQELWLGYHGTIAKRLGVFLIVDALGMLKHECPGLRFLCVGEGDDLDVMKQRAKEKNVFEMIDFRPFTEVEKLPEVLRKVHVGIIGNQRDTERKRNYMLPVKMLEYAAMEIPTIAPRLEILSRYFDDTSAFFYEADNVESLAATIRSIYNDRTLLTTRISGLRAFNAQYNWNIMAERYLGMIHDMTSAR